jgi:hypothetical protein
MEELLQGFVVKNEIICDSREALFNIFSITCFFIWIERPGKKRYG